MTLDELAECCEKAEAFAARYSPDAARPGFTLKIPGCRWGRRARVLPGLMGDVLNNADPGYTVVWVTVADVRRVLARAALGGEGG